MIQKRDLNAAPIRVTAERAIRDFILSRDLRPGDPLPAEAELCAILGCSRSSVREAIKVLSALEIVEIRRGTGTFVGTLSLQPLVNGMIFRGAMDDKSDPATLREIISLRVALDRGLASQIVEALRDHHDPLLQQSVDEMVAKAKHGEQFAQADREFHARLLSKLDNLLAAQLVDALWEIHMRILPHLQMPTPQGIEDTARAHGQMLDAAQRGDLDAFMDAIDAHYEPLREVLDVSQSSPK